MITTSYSPKFKTMKSKGEIWNWFQEHSFTYPAYYWRAIGYLEGLGFEDAAYMYQAHGETPADFKSFLDWFQGS